MSQAKHYAWSAFGKFGTQAIGFIGNILIARILSPEDFGLIAMLAIIMGLAWNFTESGFADSLIRKRNADKIDFGTVASFNLGVALLMYLIIYISAPGIAFFFQHNELTDIARVLGISIIVRAVVLPAIVELRKTLRFKDLAKMNLGTSIVSVGFTYLMALLGFGYWALVFQPIFIALSNLFYVLVIAKWRPYFRFSYNRFKEIFGFGINMLISYITNQAGSNLYSAVIGKFYPIAALGYYRQAQKMEEVPTQGLNAVILTTSYSIIAMEEDPKKQKKMYLDLFSKFVLLQSLLVLVFIGLAEPIWMILLGEKWSSSIPYFQLFMIISLSFPLATINSNIAKINNKSNLYRNLTFFRNSLKILALVFLAKTNLTVLLYGQIAAAYISVLVDMYYCGKIIDFGILKQIIQFLKMFYKPLIAFITASLITRHLQLGFWGNGVLWIMFFSSTLIFNYLLTRDILFMQIIQKLKTILNR